MVARAFGGEPGGRRLVVGAHGPTTSRRHRLAAAGVATLTTSSSYGGPTPRATLADLCIPRMVAVDTTPGWIKQVNKVATARNVRSVPELTSPSRTLPLDVPIQPMEFLLALGKATAVPGLPRQLLTVSGLWACARYCWAFAPAAQATGSRLRLSDWSAAVRYHSRSLMSEHMAIGLSTVLIERRVLPGSFDLVDAESSVAGVPPRPARGLWPDYFIPDLRSGRIHALECKGTNGSRTQLAQQFAKGIRQVLAPRLAAGSRRFIIGAVAPNRGDVRAYAAEIPNRRRGDPLATGDGDRETRAVEGSYIRLLQYAHPQSTLVSGDTDEPPQAPRTEVSPFGDVVGTEAVITFGNESVVLFAGLERRLEDAYRRHIPVAQVISLRDGFWRSLTDQTRTGSSGYQVVVEGESAWAASADGAVLGITLGVRR